MGHTKNEPGEQSLNPYSDKAGAVLAGPVPLPRGIVADRREPSML